MNLYGICITLSNFKKLSVHNLVLTMALHPPKGLLLMIGQESRVPLRFWAMLQSSPILAVGTWSTRVFQFSYRTRSKPKSSYRLQLTGANDVLTHSKRVLDLIHRLRGEENLANRAFVNIFSPPEMEKWQNSDIKFLEFSYINLRAETCFSLFFPGNILCRMLWMPMFSLSVCLLIEIIPGYESHKPVINVDGHKWPHFHENVSFLAKGRIFWWWSQGFLINYFLEKGKYFSLTKVS